MLFSAKLGINIKGYRVGLSGDFVVPEDILANYMVYRMEVLYN